MRTLESCQLPSTTNAPLLAQLLTPFTSVCITSCLTRPVLRSNSAHPPISPPSTFPPARLLCTKEKKSQARASVPRYIWSRVVLDVVHHERHCKRVQLAHFLLRNKEALDHFPNCIHRPEFLPMRVSPFILRPEATTLHSTGP